MKLTTEEKKKMYPRFKEEYTDHEIMLILSHLTTKNNRDMLAKMLDRSPGAIEYIWAQAYDISGWMLETEQRKRIKQIKEDLGIPCYMVSMTVKDMEEVTELLTRRTAERVAAKGSGEVNDTTRTTEIQQKGN